VIVAIPSAKSPSNKIDYSALDSAVRPPPVGIEVGLLTGGFDKPYAFGLAMTLILQGVCLDVIGSDEVDSPEFHANPKVRFLNLQGSCRPDVTLARKVSRVVIYYGRLLRYASNARPSIFHILWNNKIQVLDRTLLMLYYKYLGKKIAFTAHNVNAGKRDSNDSLLNRLSLRIQYWLADHIFVHTEKMKSELLEDFGVRDCAVTVIPFGINNAVPNTDLTPEQAKQRLGIREGERTILFFGRIGRYKGLEFLVAAFQEIVARTTDYRLIIAGKPKRGSEKYWGEIQRTISGDVTRGWVIHNSEYIPDEDTELYFKAADVLVLPYTQLSQSGVLFLGYSFGLPVIATDVESFREDIIEGRTGLLCKPCDPVDLAKTIEAYFESDLFKNLNDRRQEIRDYARARYSWDVVGEMTRNVYAQLLEQQGS
jgi:glycosyltransferase involved in cell wall biosynthesis